ncbi:uncharacterized protein LOC128223927 [Mya arenaria]|uniref:uncharacterized protein LOC128223927 n=1 Tax=Mya arenaria TaxID=6604 RepID=UPI0022E41850|nr:uncharacterized protein LOC128223927 [Mya arenaria]
MGRDTHVVSLCTLKGRTLRGLAFGLLILHIIQTCTFLGLISAWRFKYSTSSPLETNRQCMACDDLKPPLYNIPDTDKDISALRQRHNSSLCCGAVQNIVQHLIKKEVSLKFYDTITAGSSNILESFIHNCELEEDLKTPKAKLVGVVDSVPSFIVQGHAKLRWNKNNRTFTENNCIHLELEGEIFIRKPGYYIVSSTLNINAMRRNTTTETFSHNVNLLSHRIGSTEVLMQRKRSITESDEGDFTSVMSAVFRLQMYDRISVSVSHQEYIARNSSTDNFIAYYTYDLN